MMLFPSYVMGTTFSISVGARGYFVIHKDISSLREIRTSGITVQRYDYSCGSAAVATLLLKYFNDPIKEEEIIDTILKTGDIKKIIERRGFSFLDIKRFLEARGYKAQGYRSELQDLMELKAPVLMPISINNYKHFVLFLGVKGNRVYLVDPSVGIVTMPVYQFEDAWKERVFLLVSRSDPPRVNLEALDPLYMDDIWARINTTPIFLPHDPARFR